MKSNLYIRHNMSFKVYSWVVFIYVVILHVVYTSAQFLPSDANPEPVRITGISNQYSANSFNTIQPAIPSSLNSQPLISTPFPATANTASTSTPTTTSRLLPPRVIPNAFTQASLAIPSLQRFLNVRIPRFQATDILFKVINVALKAMGVVSPTVTANIASQGIEGLDVFTIPIYFHIKGNTVEKFLISEGIEIVPSLAQSYANSIEKSLEAHNLSNNGRLLLAVLDGYVDFVQSLGFNYAEKAYILALITNEEIKAAINATKP